jgi:hypothetical protein
VLYRDGIKVGEEQWGGAGAFTVPVTATAQPGAQVGWVGTLTVEASYDDGATWAKAILQGGAAVLQHPKGSGFVSLRATVEDTAGKSVTQTIVHAYRYGTTK